MSTELSPVEVKVLEFIEEPRWGWATDPAHSIGWCSTQAAYHVEHDRRGRAQFWTLVGLALCEEAGIEPGAILQGMRDGV